MQLLKLREVGTAFYKIPHFEMPHFQTERGLQLPLGIVSYT